MQVRVGRDLIGLLVETGFEFQPRDFNETCAKKWKLYADIGMGPDVFQRFLTV